MLPAAPTLFSTMIVRPDDRAQLLGEVAHDHVGAAAGRKRADEMDVLARILLGLRAAQRRRTPQASAKRRPNGSSSLRVTFMCRSSLVGAPLPGAAGTYAERGATADRRAAACSALRLDLGDPARSRPSPRCP